MIGVAICLKFNARRLNMRRGSQGLSRPHITVNDKEMVAQREQYYSAVRKPLAQSPCRDSNALERIPEYSEDIYPYATFHLPEQENMSANSMRSCVYDSRDTISTKQIRRASSGMGSRSKSKSFKGETEEYDSLGSDSDTPSGEQARGYSPRVRSSEKERRSYVQRPVHHSKCPVSQSRNKHISRSNY
ncbi:uncharacterized protein LOC113376959 [Ctenocephalides felis]|uniref:uncharacterized protein LOC113376959 n=1 Tax=Ctenocephalides felis TaxID=7515 RepID=UPI000E6E55F2|nr:uncharacterized protein LOC113376959 [Ctenocephalides felis]